MKRSGAEQRGPRRRVGMTPERIVESAARLTRGVGFHAWTVRDLANDLDVSVSVIYHHVGGKPEIIRRVVEGMLERLAPPRPQATWQEFFREFLGNLYPLLIEYPGTAKWLALHGPTFSGTSVFFDVGMAALRRAGVRGPALVYVMLINSALLAVALNDERLESGDDGPRDLSTVRLGLEQLRPESGGVATVIDEVLSPQIVDATGAGAELSAEYYRLLVDTLIAGVEARRGQDS